MKKVISLILCAVLALSMAACGGAAPGGTQATAGSATVQSGTTPMGRWIETEIKLGEGLYIVTVAPQESGDVWAFALTGDTLDTSEMHKYVSKDNGATWAEEALDWESVTGGKIYGNVWATANGTVLFQSIKPGADEKPGTSSLWMQKAGQAPETLEFEGFATGGRLTFYALLGSNAIALGGQTVNLESQQMDIAFALFNLETKEKICDVASDYGYIYSESFFGDSMYYPEADTAGDGTTVNLKKLNAAGETETVFPNIGTVQESTMDEKGNLYFIADKSINRVAQGGSLIEEVMDVSAFTVGKPDVYTSILTIAKNGDIIASTSTNNNMESTLYLYHFDETVPATTAQNTVELWSLTDNQAIRAAIVELGKTNKDIAVNYTVALPKGETALNTNDIISALNTEILAGAGPDIILFDGMDAAPYANKGLLVDLATVVNQAELVQNITQPFYNEGKAFTLPARFKLPIVYGQPDKVAKFTTLTALQEEILALPPRPDANVNDDAYYNAVEDSAKYALSFLGIEDLVDFTLNSGAASIIKDGKIEKTTVKELYTFIKAVSNHYGLDQYRTEQTRNAVSTSSEGGDVVELWDGTYEFAFTKHAAYGRDMMGTPGMVNNISYRQEDGEMFAFDAVLQPGPTQGAFIPTCLVGINANSKKQDLALQLVTALFSTGAQGTVTPDGMPVLKSTLDESVKRSNPGKSKESGYLGDVTALLAQARTPILVDAIVKEKLLQHAQLLCEGTQTVDAAVDGFANELALYLAEKG